MLNMKKRIYMDHASTTPLDPKVKKAMEPYFTDIFANPASPCREGVIAWNALALARKNVSQTLNCRTEEVIFTSGGTESNNLAILGSLAAFRQSGKNFSDMHVVTSSIEHSSVRECLKAMEDKGLQVTYLPVGERGIVNPRDLEKVLTEKTVLVSIMYANNEIGTIQPVQEIGRVLRLWNEKRNVKIVFHSDASQAPLYLPLDTHSLGADLLTLDGHKIYGPKGVGVLFVRKDTELVPLMKGGSQEKSLRPGTENVPLAVGMAAALLEASRLREKESTRLIKLRDYAIAQILKHIPKAILNGDAKNRLPNNINISLPDTDTEFLIIQLDEKGIAASTKSACLETDAGSYVIEALGGDIKRNRSSLRLTFGRSTIKAEVDYVVKCVKELVGSHIK
jgi:cysteine desulfurase